MIIPQRLLRNAVTYEEYRWPGYPGKAIIPYVISENLDLAKENITKAMEIYHKNTCVRFVPRTIETDYLDIFQGNLGCYATVGRDTHRVQPQPVGLAAGCFGIGTILHELGHSLGFFHEQNRSDRDDYIIVHEDNVMDGLLSNFQKLDPKENLLLTPFDYDSIMIYGNYAFSKDGSSMTLEAKNGQRLLDPFSKTTMTDSDFQRIRMLYKCED